MAKEFTFLGKVAAKVAENGWKKGKKRQPDLGGWDSEGMRTIPTGRWPAFIPEENAEGGRGIQQLAHLKESEVGHPSIHSLKQYKSEGEIVQFAVVGG